MDSKDWNSERADILADLGRLESWTQLLLEAIEESKKSVENSDDGFILTPASHPVGVPEFEMLMRDIDSPLREILARHKIIQDYYRHNRPPLDSGQLLEKSDLTNSEVAEVLGLVQALSKKEGGFNSTVHISEGEIKIQIEEEKKN